MNESILSGAYTRDLNSYIETINQMHVISAKGKNGNIDWYSSVGQGSLGVDAGVIRGKGSLRNNRVETAELSENIALRYGDSYRTSNSGSTVKLKGIPKEYLPQDFGTQHFYPDGMGLNHYYKEMHRTAQEALDLIANGATEKQFLAKIAEHYQYAANARPYSQINNSLFMNEINTLLKRAGMKTIPHGNLDTVAMHLQPESFKKYFIDEYYKNAI